MTTVRLGLIGAGTHGRRYAKHIVEEIPQATLVSLCRRNRQEGEMLASTYGCAYYGDYRQLLRDERVDAVVIVVPPALHGTIVPAACQAGKHILLEKPFAISVAEGQRLCAEITAHGVRCMVAHTLRFNSVVRALKAHIPQIAPLHSLYISQRFEPSPLLWLDRKAESGGGIMLHTGVHSFDLLRFLSGCEVATVQCEMRAVKTLETEDNFTMLCQLLDPANRHGIAGTVAGSRSTTSRSGLIELSGEHGQLMGDHHYGFAYLMNGPERTALPLEPPVPTVREIIRAFVEGLHAGTAFPITPDDGLRAVAIAEACYRSAESEQRVRIEL